MDHYPEVNVNERECLREDWSSSRHDSASSISKAVIEHTNEETSQQQAHQPSQYTSFPPPSSHSSQRTNSTNSNSSTCERARQIDAEYARYTDAPPPYSEKQYEGKSDDEQTNMRMKDYAKELSRMMGRQLVRGLKAGQRKDEVDTK